MADRAPDETAEMAQVGTGRASDAGPRHTSGMAAGRASGAAADEASQAAPEDASEMTTDDPSELAPGASAGAPRDDRALALAQIKKRRDFNAHLFVYVVVNVAIWGIWGLTGGGYPWPAWVSGAWAVGLVLNAWDVHARRPISEGEIEREIERLQPRRRG